MIAVGLAGRITELFCQLHHDKGIQMKDTADEIAKIVSKEKFPFHPHAIPGTEAK